MKSTLRWLHITDLHCGMSEGKRLWPNVKERFFEDLAYVHERSGPLDLVLFTGDLTQRGSAENFKELDEELDELWAELEGLGSRPSLVAVPGNHDLVRPDAKKAAVKAMRAWHDDKDIRDEFWRDASGEYRGVVSEAFKEYASFTERFVARHPWPTGYTVTKGALPGELSVSFEKGGVRYLLVGLNSAFLQLDDRDYLGRLDLDTHQLAAVCGKDYPKEIRKHGVALLLTHHPTSWLHPRGLETFRGEMAPPGRFFAHLFGHMHLSRAATTTIGGAEALRETQGSSLLGLEAFGDGTTQRMHGYSAGGLDIDNEQGDYVLWPRAAVKHMAGAYQMVPDNTFRLRDERVTERFIARPSAGAAPRGASAEAPKSAPQAAVPVAAPPVAVVVPVPVASQPVAVTAPVAPQPVAPAAPAVSASGPAFAITAPQFEALVKALLAAFPSGPSLSRLARFKLDLNLAAVATGNLHDQAFALVEWAEAKGRLRDLIVGARQENPGNPTLAVFATSVGVAVDVPAVAPTAPADSTPAQPAPATVPEVALTSDPGAIARELRAVLASLYSDARDAIRLAHDAGIARGRIDFTGSMQAVWFDVLEEAAKSGRLGELVAAARVEYPQHPALARLARLAINAPSPSVAWTSTTVFEALTTLLPVQFEELVFRLAVPTHFIPGSTAPLAERAVALVRIFEQQGRLGEVVAALGRLGVRPKRG